MSRDIESQRSAKRRYYERNREVYREKNRRKRDRMREVLRQAKSKPCTDCGGEFPYFVMDLDHREGEVKGKEVGRLIATLSFRRLLVEIVKCDVVCSNCHRIRTHSRGQYYSGMGQH